MKLVEIQNVSKSFVNHCALDDVSMDINEGTIFGLLGPNGAGKTTLIRILNQITLPDKGQILFQGHLLSRSDIERVGYLPEERGLYKKMTVGEQAVYLAQLKGLSRAEAIQRLNYWFRKFEIEKWWNKKTEELSKGMQQKVQFIVTIIHEPTFLIFDEPFSGFDPINANLLKTEILELKKRGATIILSTHNMASVEEICDEIALINKSKKILNGPLAQIKQQYKQNQFQMKLSGVQEGFRDRLPSRFAVLSEEQQSGITDLTVKLTDGATANDLLNAVLPIADVLAFNEILPSMNDIFIQAVNQA
ncbi:MAG: ATP-binding cassette domain-containing protein [Bacteroidales bacterium]|nr:ATP-binding cassette domain-containing protein [Bacteroidales bacterium]